MVWYIHLQLWYKCLGLPYLPVATSSHVLMAAIYGNQVAFAPLKIMGVKAFNDIIASLTADAVSGNDKHISFTFLSLAISYSWQEATASHISW